MHIISEILALYQDEQWVPRRTIYRGGSQKPQFDSFHPENANRLAYRSKVPSDPHDSRIGHSGTTILNYWLLGIKVQKAKETRLKEAYIHSN